MTLVRVEKTKTGFEIIAFIREPMEDMYERLTHAAIFPYEDEAQALATKIRHALTDAYGSLNALNLDYWLWTPSNATPYGALQKNPTAKRWVVGVDTPNQKAAA